MSEDVKQTKRTVLPWVNFVFLIFLAIIVLDNIDAEQAVKSLPKDSLLEHRIAGLEKEQLEFDERIRNNAIEIFKIRYLPSLQSSAAFTPEDEGFQKIETGVGDLFVSLQNIETYANGHKVTFHVGNPYAANIIHANAILSYGGSYEEFSQKLSEEESSDSSNVDAWNATLKTSEKEIKGGFKGRSWNKLSFIVAPSEPEEMGFLRLSLEAKGLELYTNDN